MHNYRFIIIALLLSASSFAQAQFTQNLAKVYNGIGDFNDRFTCIAKDANGNIIVAGSTVTTGQSRDVLVQKYDAAGAVVWTATFDGADSGADEAAAIVTDAQNNVFVTGYQKGVGVGNDILTLKINAAGTILWSAVYNSLYNEADQGVSIALDATGAVLVAANSDRDSTTTSNDDIVTLKYDATNGAQIWEKRFNGTGNAGDRPVRVRCDANNNVFVTGRTFNGNNDDFITIKYNAASMQQWAKTEDRTGNDRPTDMLLDSNGDIYVTGRSKVNNFDFYTVKYNNATGTRNWAKTYNSLDDDRATCMTIDAANNIYVGGQVDVNANTATNIYDFGVVKYSSAGVQAWATVTPFTTDDVPSGISVSNNTVAMSGYATNTNLIKDILTVQLNATSGVLNWSKFYNGAALKNDDGNALTTDATDNIYVAGSTEGANGQKDALLIKYTTSGTVAFEKIHVGAGDNSDNARAMTTDAAGNVYMAGYRTTTTDRDFAVWKINTVGDTVWTRTFNGTSSYSSDEAVSIALDATNNVYVTGSAKNAGVGFDIITIKLDNNGALAWQKTFDNGGLKQNDKADAMAIDATGNVYIVGRTDVNTSSYTNEDALLISYTPAGVLRFTKVVTNTGNGNDRFSHIQIAANGNVYAVGRTFANSNDNDILVQKYNSAGVLQWQEMLHYTNDDIVTATALDAAENLYIGAYTGFFPGNDALLLKYNSAGLYQSVIAFSNLNIFDARINALALDATNNLYAAGFTNLANAAGVNTDALLVKFSTAGAATYMFNPLTPNTNGDELTCVAIDAAGNVLTAGTEGLSTNKNLVVNMHDTNGAYLAQTTFDGTAANDDIPNIMRIANGQLYVAGSSQSLNAGRDALLLRYTYTRPVATENIALDATINVFPNPFTDIINFEIKTANNATENYTIQIFDALGRKVAEKTAKSNEITAISLEGLGKGVYTYKVFPDHSRGGEARGISGRLIKM